MHLSLHYSHKKIISCFRRYESLHTHCADIGAKTPIGLEFWMFLFSIISIMSFYMNHWALPAGSSRTHVIFGGGGWDIREKHKIKIMTLFYPIMISALHCLLTAFPPPEVNIGKVQGEEGDTVTQNVFKTEVIFYFHGIIPRTPYLWEKYKWNTHTYMIHVRIYYTNVHNCTLLYNLTRPTQTCGAHIMLGSAVMLYVYTVVQ